MKCLKCGKEINDSEIFCGSCGARVDRVVKVNKTVCMVKNVSLQALKGTKKALNDFADGMDKKKAIRIGIAVVGIIVISVLGTKGIGYVSELLDKKKIAKCIDNGEYSKAYALSNDNEEYSKQITSDMKKRVKEIYDEYVDDKISYDELCTEFDNISEAAYQDIDENTENYVSSRLLKADFINMCRENYESGIEQMKNEDYDEAVISFRRVGDQDAAYHKKAKEKIEECGKKVFEGITESIKDNIDNGEFDYALTRFSEFDDSFIDEESYKEEIEELRKYAYIKMGENVDNLIIDMYTTGCNTGDIVYRLYEILEYGDDSYVKDKADTYVAEIVEEAKVKIADLEFEAAIDMLEYLPEEAKNDEINQLIADNKGKSVTNIVSIKYIDNQDIEIIEGDITDSRTNVHEASYSIKNSSSFFGFPLSGYVVLPLNGKYTTFMGKIACAEGCPSDSVGNIQVLCDDKVVYESGDITNRMQAVDFNIDVCGVNDLELKFNVVDNGETEAFASSGNGIKMIMINPTVY